MQYITKIDCHGSTMFFAPTVRPYDLRNGPWRTYDDDKAAIHFFYDDNEEWCVVTAPDDVTVDNYADFENRMDPFGCAGWNFVHDPQIATDFDRMVLARFRTDAVTA